MVNLLSSGSIHITELPIFFETKLHVQVVIEFQKHDNYQNSNCWLLNFLDSYASHALDTAGNGEEPGKKSPQYVFRAAVLIIFLTIG